MEKIRFQLLEEERIQFYGSLAMMKRKRSQIMITNGLKMLFH
jgi:hypothetical protein